MPRDRNICDVEDCRSRKGSGWCELNAVWIKPDHKGRPVCQSYKPVTTPKENKHGEGQ